MRFAAGFVTFGAAVVGYISLNPAGTEAPSFGVVMFYYEV